MDWAEIIVPAATVDIDEVAALLADACEPARQGTEIRGDEVVMWAPLAGAEAALAEVRAAVAVLATAGLGVDPGEVRSQPALPEAEWRDAWKKYFHVTRLTRRLVVVPSWERFAPGPDDLVIHLDPGMAFGTGGHASTRLVLAELERLHDGGAVPARVLDVGAGSGILAIAAARLWPDCRVVAIDNDPIAVAAAAENCAANQVGERVACSVTPAGSVEGEFAVVVANIQAHVLRELAGAIVARVAPGGTVVLSGLLAAQVEAVADQYAARGLRRVAIRPDPVDPAWSTAVLLRPASP